jgi:hypothetical protein
MGGRIRRLLWTLENNRIERERASRVTATEICDFRKRVAIALKQEPPPCQTQAELDREAEAREAFDYAWVIGTPLMWLAAGWAAIAALYVIVRWIVKGFRPAT